MGSCLIVFKNSVFYQFSKKIKHIQKNKTTPPPQKNNKMNDVGDISTVIWSH